MLRNDHRLKLACGALITLGFVVWVSSPTTTTVAPTTTAAPTTTVASTTVAAPITTVAPTTALASTTTVAVKRQGVGQVEQTAPTTTVVPTAVEGVVLSRTGSSTLPLFFTGVVLVLFGTLLEFSSRRRKLQMLTLRPFQTVGISDVLRQMARSRQAFASKPVRVSDLAPARTHSRARDACLWRYRIW